jgi:hypothetical protein
MNSIKFKIKSYDEASNSLLISFASDTTASTDPEQYPAYAFQPATMWPDVAGIDELKKRIAMAGMYQAQTQEAKEKLAADPQQVAKFKELVGQTYEFTVAQLSDSSATPIATV